MEEYGAMDYTIIVNASASDPAAMQFLAPYAGVAMGEYSATTGRQRADDLRRFDETGGGVSRDFSAFKTTAGSRSVSGRRFLSSLAPSRTRAKMSDARGGGSLTSLPFIETQAGDILGVYSDERNFDYRRADLSLNPIFSTPAFVRQSTSATRFRASAVQHKLKQ
jgi:F-type H+-transporting ATPase subunit alpha